MTPTELNAELRILIDARLEAVDGILLRAQVGWSERRSIIGEVETQIYELLSRRSALPGEEDVQAVLASLDPPEAYIPDELRDQLADAPTAANRPQGQSRQLSHRVQELVAQVAPGAVCAAALVVANGVVLVIIKSTNGVIPWLITLGGIAWLNYVGFRWYRSWSATQQGNPFNDLRHSLSKWLMPKNEARAT
jgi:hypothetical protein